MNPILYCICLSFIATASISANMLAPAFPAISQQLHASASDIHWLMAVYLCGYIVGQLIYGPLANAYGRMHSLRYGFMLNLLGILLCLLAAHLHAFKLLLFSRLITALGASAGLTCTFILIKERLPEAQAKRAMLHVNVIFALGIGISTMIGGMLAQHGHWTWIFWALLLHGIYLLLATYLFPESAGTQTTLSPSKIIHNYTRSLRNPILVSSAVCVGFATALNYCYATTAPSISIHMLHLNVAHYGMLNWINIGGMLIFSLLGANLLLRFGAAKCLLSGLLALLPALLSLAAMLLLHRTSVIWLFATTAWIFAFSRIIYASAAYLATNKVEDTANAASLMSFINLSTATLGVIIMGYFPFSGLMDFALITLLLYCISWFMVLIQKLYKPKEKGRTLYQNS